MTINMDAGKVTIQTTSFTHYQYTYIQGLHQAVSLPNM